MSDRLWFYASGGQQQGPVPESQLSDLIRRGTVGPDTLVWTEGMANWEKAGGIPGLMAAMSAPRTVAGSDAPVAADYGYAGGRVSIDFGIWDFTWRSFALCFGIGFVIPMPWAVVMYCRWIVSCVHVPGRPNLSFTGEPKTLFWFFAAVALIVVVELFGNEWLSNLMVLVQIALYWLAIRWFVANIASNGQPLGLTFTGSIWGYLGWSILAALSVITIIGWAWVYTAQTRWMCRHVEGTHREVVFTGTGLEVLWRGIVVLIGSVFLIPIPWVWRWFMQWQASQVVLVERGAPTSM